LVKLKSINVGWQFLKFIILLASEFNNPTNPIMCDIRKNIIEGMASIAKI